MLGYRLYWGASNTSKVLSSSTGETISSLNENIISDGNSGGDSTTNQNLPVHLHLNLSPPNSAIYFLVYAFNKDGESRSSVSLRFHDAARPTYPPRMASFSGDSDKRPGVVTGTINITRAVSENDVDEYWIVWTNAYSYEHSNLFHDQSGNILMVGAEHSHSRSRVIATIKKSNLPDLVFFPRAVHFEYPLTNVDISFSYPYNVSVETNMDMNDKETGFLVVTANSDGALLSLGAFAAVHDVGVPARCIPTLFTQLHP